MSQLGPSVIGAVPKPPFLVGLKQIRLPRFAIELHRTTHLGPKYATFTVPLWFSKLDLRDYLYHAYDVRILSARSYVKQSKVTQGKPSYVKEPYEGIQYHRWHRPKSIKRMTVELESPFVWPEAPTDLAPWEQEHHDDMQEAQKVQQNLMGPSGDTAVNLTRRESLREQAAALLEGREKWKPPENISHGPLLRR